MTKDSAQTSKSSGVTMQIGDQEVQFTEREVKIGRIMYFVLVICMIATVGGLAWTIGDVIAPTGKLADFLNANLGSKIIIIGVACFILFFLLVFFYGMHRKGSLFICKAIFGAKKLYREMKTTKLAQFTSGGLMVSIIIFAVGFIWLIIQIIVWYTTNTSAPTPTGLTQSTTVTFWFLSSITGGELFLAIGILAVAIVCLTIGIAWLWNAGNIFFARLLMKLEKQRA
ncbi:MAG TPA: hypothetical protein VKK79_20630 [Candidatus Lokiarchaeia archaeon]|nr:hypothetical protein [Candidatus Lokiarchaeia archaeon]